MQRPMVGRLVLLVLGVLLLSLAATAPPAGKMPRIGVLAPGTPAGPWVDAFRQGLRALGYVEDQTIALDIRWDEYHPERSPALAADLVRLRVDLIVVGTAAATRAAQHATSTIPIVMATSADPVGDGLVASLARPGGNITGLSGMGVELTGKRLELLTAAVPGLARVALLLDAEDPRRHIRLQAH
jgi:putative tryptophan/tyrosine transport system substrate-binding protein